MEIIEYSEEFAENVKDLLVELQTYISDLDKDGYNFIDDGFREKYFAEMMNIIKEKNGKIFLAKTDDLIVGLIVGIINNEKEKDYDFVAPKRGRILELVVSQKYRSNGVGKILISKMEEYFKSIGCKGILLEVFALNSTARIFYSKNGYYERSVEMMKKL